MMYYCRVSEQADDLHWGLRRWRLEICHMHGGIEEDADDLVLI